MKIGELTRLAGCTVKAVRFYEATGLLPRATRSPSGYRLYTEHDVKRLAFIQRAKLMGLPLGKIKDLVAHLSETECACPKIRPHLEHLVREQLRGHRGDEYEPARAAQEGPQGIPVENEPGEAGLASGTLARAPAGTGSGSSPRIEDPAQTGSRMTRAAPPRRDEHRFQAPPAVLAGAFLFNLGQRVLRPTLPLYLRAVFAANYRRVTLTPSSSERGNGWPIYRPDTSWIASGGGS